MVFQWSLCDSKSPQVSRTLLSILAVFNNALVCMVSTRPPTSKSSSLFNSPLVTVLSAPISFGIIVTFMFHNFFSSLARSRYLFFFSLSFSFILCSAGTAKSIILQDFFLSITIRSGLLAKIWWSVCMSKSYRSLCVSFSKTAAGLCIKHLFGWGNLHFLHISHLADPVVFSLILPLCLLSDWSFRLLCIWGFFSPASPYVSSTSQGILTDLSNAVVGMVLILPSFEWFQFPFHAFGVVLRIPNKTGINHNRMFLSFILFFW